MPTQPDLIEERASLKRQLQAYHRNLLRLQEQKAQYGLNVPLDILNGIDDAEDNIKRIRLQLQEIEALLENLPPEPEPVAESTPAEPQELGPLKEALSRRTLVLFIGADLPQDVRGLPSRTDLAQALAHRKGLDESLSLAEVAQRINQAGNRFEVTNFLRTALDTIGRQPTSFQQQIVSLTAAHQLDTLISTAYDNLLEVAFQQAGLGLNRVLTGSDVIFINPDRPTLIKLYGDISQLETLVVTDQDHTDLLRNRDKEGIIEEVKRAFRRNTVLFLGYNLADPDFRFLFDQIAESRFARTAYAVWSGLPPADKQMWRERGIVILEADPLPTLQGS